MCTWIKICPIYSMEVWSKEISLIWLTYQLLDLLENTIFNSRNPCSKHFLWNLRSIIIHKTLIIKANTYWCLLHVWNTSTLQKWTHFIFPPIVFSSSFIWIIKESPECNHQTFRLIIQLYICEFLCCQSLLMRQCFLSWKLIQNLLSLTHIHFMVFFPQCIFEQLRGKNSIVNGDLIQILKILM